MSLPDFGKATSTHLQLASAGKWENAVQPDDLTEDNLDAWLSTTASDVAIEAVFKDSTGKLLGFVGFRRILEEMEARRVFWKSLMEQSRAASKHDTSAYIEAWLWQMVTPLLLQNPPSSLELGVFNQWKSAGSIQLVEGVELAQLVQSGPSWLRSGATAPICLERVWRTPDRFWIAECVSRLIDGNYQLDADRLLLKGK